MNYIVTMTAQHLYFKFCFIFICMSTCQGLHFFMDKNPDKDYCGHLYCWSDVGGADNNVFSVIGLSIFVVSHSSTPIKLASLSVFGTDISVRESELKTVNASGSVSKFSAELNLNLREKRHCENGSFLCELSFINASGDANVIQNTATSTNSKSSRDIEKENIELRKQVTTLKTEVKLLTEQKTVPQNVTEEACYKKVPFSKPRGRFLLWDNVPALCDIETDRSGGWIVIQRRTKGDVDFYRGWDDYKKGFGTPDTDFWLGLDIIHNLTSQNYTELRIDMEHQGKHYFAQYSSFKVANVTYNYRLSVKDYKGTAPDSFTPHDGMQFSTYDRDNDYSDSSCAHLYYGAWWYKGCFRSNLNGGWGFQNLSGVWWYGITISSSLSFSEIKIRCV